MTIDLGPVRDLVGELRPLIGARTDAAVLRAGVAALARRLNDERGLSLDVPGDAPTAAMPFPDPWGVLGRGPRQDEQDGGEEGDAEPEQTSEGSPAPKRRGRPVTPPKGGE